MQDEITELLTRTANGSLDTIMMPGKPVAGVMGTTARGRSMVALTLAQRYTENDVIAALGDLPRSDRDVLVFVFWLQATTDQLAAALEVTADHALDIFLDAQDRFRSALLKR